MQAQSTTDWRPVLEEPGPHTGTIPGAIYDRPSELGGYEYAQQTHYNTVRALFHAHGIYVAEYYYDEGSGGNAQRKAYQELLRAVRLRRVEAVGVDSMARLGRNGPERLKALEEFDRLGVPCWRADKERPDEPRIIRYVEAWQDEEYLREQARKAVDNLPAVVRAGKHMGRTNIGYKRVFRYLYDEQNMVESVMVKDQPYARLVRDVYTDYAAGKSVLGIVHDLNQGALPNPYAASGRWSTGTVHSILRSKVYLGRVTWAKTHPGKYRHYQGAVLDEKGKHEPILDQELVDRVQARLMGKMRTRTVNQRGHHTALLDGLLVCAQCGAKTYLHYNARRMDGSKGYVCANRHRGTSACAERRISARVAEQAVLDQVRRLRGVPWDPEAFDAAVRKDPNEAQRHLLRTELADLEQQMQVNAAMFSAAADLSPEAVEAFRKNALPLSLKIRHVKDQLAALPDKHADPVRAKELYDLAAWRDLAALIDNAQADGDEAVLRDMLTAVVARAWITERGSMSGGSQRATWARAAVEWTPEVVLLLEAGRFTLAAEERAPRKTPQEYARERKRRYRARQRQLKLAGERAAHGQ